MTFPVADPACLTTARASVPDAEPSLLPSPPSVAHLLTESRGHNLARIRLANRLRGSSHVPDYRAAEAEAALALEKRLAAHDLDPEHTDPSWALDTTSHEEIVAFLSLYKELP